MRCDQRETAQRGHPHHTLKGNTMQDLDLINTVMTELELSYVEAILWIETNEPDGDFDDDLTEYSLGMF